MTKLRMLLPVLLAICAVPAIATDSSWNYKHGKEIKWMRLAGSGDVLAASDSSIFCLNPETGTERWKRDDLQGISSYQADEIEGTPFLVVSKNNFGSTKVSVLDIQTGKTEWETDKIKGATIGIFPVYEKDMVIIFTSHASGEAKTKPTMYAFTLSTGQALWETEFADKVDLHMAEAHGRFIQHFDLSGHMEPVIEGDAIYFTYAGAHRYDLNTGKLVWAVPYDVTEGKLKRANARAVIGGDILYTSAKGQLRALDKNSGAVKWLSPDYGAAIAELAVRGNVIYGRMGGEFFDDKDRQWKLKNPLGVVAVSANSGQMVWKYDGARDAITNMAFVDGGKTILIADAKNVIGLDTTLEGKVKEAYKFEVEFKQFTSAAQKINKVARFGLGGIQGGMKGMQNDKKNQDRPITIYQAEKGFAVIRGRQNLIAFDPDTRKIIWAASYAPPGVSNFEMIAMTAVYAMSYASSTAVASNTYAGTWQNTQANNDRQNALLGYSKMLNKRYSVTRVTDFHAFMLTTVEDGKDKGPGIVGINMETGDAIAQILLKQKDPDYVVDIVTGRLFDRRGDTIEAYTIR
jgi:outer membrane protein assembly factor BamB